MRYGSAQILCPYYNDHSPKSIICEGIVSRYCVQNFGIEKQRKEHTQKYCMCDYNECEIAQNLEKKYN